MKFRLQEKTRVVDNLCSHRCFCTSTTSASWAVPLWSASLKQRLQSICLTTQYVDATKDAQPPITSHRRFVPPWLSPRQLRSPSVHTRQCWACGGYGCWLTGAGRASLHAYWMRQGVFWYSGGTQPHAILLQGMQRCWLCRAKKADGVFGADNAGRTAGAGVLQGCRAAAGV